MTKAILSPLFICLIVLWPIFIISLVKERGVLRILSLVSCLALAVVTLSSTGVVAGYLEESLESDYSIELRCPQDAVVVLSGGYAHGEKDDSDWLGGESVLRLIKGVQLFRQCNTKWLILSGSSKGGLRGRDADLMQELALKLGVQKERIQKEIMSANTREHPIGIRDMGLFGEGAELAVVTSPWHLRRSMTEFLRIFPRAYPIMAYGDSRHNRNSLYSWIPQSGSLDRTTRMIHEYIGYLWYKVRNASAHV